MNDILASYVNDFSDKNNLKDIELSEKFEHFMNYSIIKREFTDDIDFEILHTGGGQDMGIDGLAILNGTALINSYSEEDIKNIVKHNKNFDFVFIQSKTSHKFNNKDLLIFLNGVFDFFNENYEDIKKNSNKIIHSCKRILQLILKYDISIHLKYVFTGNQEKLDDANKLIENHKKRLDDLGIFKKINIEIYHYNEIMKMHKEIELNLKKEIQLEKIIALPKNEKVQEAYVGIIPLNQLKELIYDNAKGRIISSLFYDNIRGYQGNETRVNKEIQNTLDTDKEYFGLYHNGITLLQNI